MVMISKITPVVCLLNDLNIKKQTRYGRNLQFSLFRRDSYRRQDNIPVSMFLRRPTDFKKLPLTNTKTTHKLLLMATVTLSYY